MRGKGKLFCSKENINDKKNEITLLEEEFIPKIIYIILYE